jgi:hypothetical protein
MAHKLSVTIGDNKIEYEGDSGEVAERFDRLTEMLVRARTNGHGRGPVEEAPPKPEPQEHTEPASGDRESASQDEGSKEDEPFPSLDREPAYSRRDLQPLFGFDGPVPHLSNPDRPSEAVDRVLLMFYGFWALNGERSVTAPAMGKAVTAAGDEKQRLDRLLADHEDYYMAKGKYRGKRYALTAEGVDYCEEVILNELGQKEN